ncbi:MAG: ABC transporter ATP-binding protein [Pseudomonadota bacterium]
MMSGRVVLKVKGLSRSYPTGDGTLQVLKDLDLTLRAGELVGLVGPSGSGKSTLLHSIGLLERPNSGEVELEDEVCYLNPRPAHHLLLERWKSRVNRFIEKSQNFPIRLVPMSWAKAPIFLPILLLKIIIGVLFVTPVRLLVFLPIYLLHDFLTGKQDKRRTRLRREKLGFVYQFHHLLPEFNARDNVAMPLMVGGLSRRKARLKADALLTDMGLSERLTHQPGQMSGGEQQRVAIARALVNDPRLVIADEPTGNLDPATTERVFESLIRMARSEGAAVLVATHNMALTQHMDRVLTLKDGKLTEFS